MPLSTFVRPRFGAWPHHATRGGSGYSVMADTAYTISSRVPMNHVERPPLDSVVAVIVATSTITTAPGQNCRSIGLGPST